MKKKTNRVEITLLVVLIIGLVTYGIYQFLYVPKTNIIKGLEQELETLKAEKAVINEKVESIPRIEDGIAAAEMTAHSSAPMFFYNVIQENLILLLDEFSDNAPMKVSSYGFAEASAGNITTVNPSIGELQYSLKQMVDNYIIKYGTDEQRLALLEHVVDLLPEDGIVPKDTSEASQIAKTSVSISFQSTYKELISYLKLFEDYNRTIVVNNLSISGQDENSISGSMSIDFYELPKLFPKESDYVYSEWTQELPKGKSSPFGNASGTTNTGNNSSSSNTGGANSTGSSNSSGAGNANNTSSANNTNNMNTSNNSSNTGNTNNNNNSNSSGNTSGSNNTNGGNTDNTTSSTASKEPDFFIIARSYYSDLPTMTVGLSSDDKGDTFIRDTSEGQQTVTVELTEKDGKYYYSYKTDKISYPAIGANEFTPSGDSTVNFVIYSSRRSSDKDVNMLNIVINNKTGLELNTVINGDDRTRPRINLTKK